MPSTTLRKCFELAGAVPLGVFLLVHVLAYSAVLFDGSSFGVADPRSSGLLALELLVVWAPLIFHGLYGVLLCFSAGDPSDEERRGTFWLRVTGLLALAFIVTHAVWLRLPLLRGERAPEDVAQMLTARLSATFQGLPLNAAFHLVGLGAVCLHLLIALPRFFKKWGLPSPTAVRRVFQGLVWLVFAVGAATVVHLATGSAVPRFLSK